MTYNNVPAERSAGELMQGANSQTMAMIGRQSQEVQAAVFMAKQFPRDIQSVENRVLMACSRPSLAKVATYEYPRGGQKVTGPSIRLAEAIAQAYGNIDTGIVELERKAGESVAMAYAWDLESNYRQTKTFTVPHIRETKKGSQALTDSRDIYELVANQGARRLRACILGVIPGDLVDTALEACNHTLTQGNVLPIEQRINEALTAFNNEFGVTKRMMEARFQRNAESFSEKILVDLMGIYNSIKDGMSRPEQWFDYSIEQQPQQVAQMPPQQQPQTGTVDMAALAEEVRNGK